MISFFSLFWIFFALFAVIGATRGRTKEFIVSLSAIVGIFLNLLLETYVPFYRNIVLSTNPTTLFIMRAGVLLVVVIMGYVTPTLPQVVLRTEGLRPVSRLRNLFLGNCPGRFEWLPDHRKHSFLPEFCRISFSIYDRARPRFARRRTHPEHDQPAAACRANPSRHLLRPGDRFCHRDRSIHLMTHYHFIGIGGTGLSAIARVLVEKGHTVSGSDRILSPQAQELQSIGVKVCHRPCGRQCHRCGYRDSFLCG